MALSRNEHAYILQLITSTQTWSNQTALHVRRHQGEVWFASHTVTNWLGVTDVVHLAFKAISTRPRHFRPHVTKHFPVEVYSVQISIGFPKQNFSTTCSFPLTCLAFDWEILTQNFSKDLGKKKKKKRGRRSETNTLLKCSMKAKELWPWFIYEKRNTKKRVSFPQAGELLEAHC